MTHAARHCFTPNAVSSRFPFFVLRTIVLWAGSWATLIGRNWMRALTHDWFHWATGWTLTIQWESCGENIWKKDVLHSKVSWLPARLWVFYTLNIWFFNFQFSSFKLRIFSTGSKYHQNPDCPWIWLVAASRHFLQQAFCIFFFYTERLVGHFWLLSDLFCIPCCTS